MRHAHHHHRLRLKRVSARGVKHASSPHARKIILSAHRIAAVKRPARRKWTDAVAHQKLRTFGVPRAGTHVTHLHAKKAKKPKKARHAHHARKARR